MRLQVEQSTHKSGWALKCNSTKIQIKGVSVLLLLLQPIKTEVSADSWDFVLQMLGFPAVLKEAQVSYH